jgi:hypothetical protein
LSWGRLTQRGITYSQAGENIAWGQTTGRAVLESWLHSPGHRKNLENRAFTVHGVGKVGTYWTHIFIRPAKQPDERYLGLGSDPPRRSGDVRKPRQLGPPGPSALLRTSRQRQ